eukprot:scaffold280003_cov35-Tisochrysis_lutea.AAC.1
MHTHASCLNSSAAALLSQAPAGMAAVQSGVTSSFIARVPPLVPRSSISDSGGLQVQGELQETGEDDAARQSPRKQR